MPPVEHHPLCLPNLLTAARIAAIPAIISLALKTDPASHAEACAAFTAACATDWLDGALARRGWGATRLGAVMDATADKMIVTATLMAMLSAGSLPWWGVYPAAVIAMREIMVGGMREFLAADSLKMPSTHMAKWKTGVQMAALATLLAGDAGAAKLGLSAMPTQNLGMTLLCVAASMTVASAWGYARGTIAHALRGAQPQDVVAGEV